MAERSEAKSAKRRFASKINIQDILMQNVENLLHILDHLNLKPREMKEEMTKDDSFLSGSRALDAPIWARRRISHYVSHGS